MTPTIGIALAVTAILVIAVAALVRAARSAYIAAQPDQWLLRIRNGRLLNAGVGISCWRRPGDVVVVFTSTLQRVRFTATALSNDRIRTVIEGFILWSVADQGEAPFRAFREMGLIDLSRQAGDMRARKHLLTTTQHRAFRTLLAAELQRHASSMSLRALLLDQDTLVEGLSQRLEPLAEALGIQISQVEIVSTQAKDDDVMHDLAAEQRQAIHAQAELIRLEGKERAKQHAIESAARIALEEAAAKRGRIETERDLRQRQQVIDAQLALDAEQSKAQLAVARREREAEDLRARLAAVRAEAEAKRDAVLALAEADEQTSPEVRDHQRQRQLVDKLTEALGAMPIRDARWVSVGGDSPVSSLVGLVHGLKDAIDQAGEGRMIAK